MQKKITFIAGFLLVSLASQAQFQKGMFTANFDVGDIRSISIQNKKFDKHNSFSFNPGFGYFIKKNWELGLKFNYTSFHLNDSSHGGSYENSRSIGFDLYTNYYFGNGKLRPYLTAKIGWGHAEGRYDLWGSGLSSFSNSNFNYALGGGLNWNISPKFSLFAEATFVRSSPFNRYGHGRSNFTIGARFFFNRQKK